MASNFKVKSVEFGINESEIVARNFLTEQQECF